MPRLILNDEKWSKLKPIILQIGIYNKRNLRLTVEGILYRLRVGCPWRDLPQEFGKWNAIYKRFNEWSSKEKLTQLFYSIIEQPDMEWQFIDGSIVKAHQHSSGAMHGEETGIGKSRWGNTSKIHLAVDSFGWPIHFKVTGGEVHDCKIAPSFIKELPISKYLIGDKGYDSEDLRQQIRSQNIVPIIPRRRNSSNKNQEMDWFLYKYRHLVENAFARLKHFRSIATRYDKLKRNYIGMIALACTFIWLPLRNGNSP